MRAAALLVLAGLAACASRGDVEPEADGEGDGKATVAVRFEGRKELAERDLLAAARRELASYREKGRRPADAADAAYSMELLYRDEGYAHAGVSFAQRPDALLFKIEEGPLVRLGPVRLEGVAQVPYSELEPLVEFEGPAFGEPVFRRSEVEAAASEVEAAYLLRGFLDVEVEDPDVDFSDDRARANVRIRVREGKQYVVERVEWEGVDPPDDDRTEGEPYHVRVPAQVAARVRRRLLDAGHQRAEVDYETEIDRERARAVIRIRAKPGPVVRLHALRFEGQERTRERFLRRRVPLSVGDVVAQRLLDRGLDNLFRSGLFSQVRPHLASKGEDETDLTIELEELKARTLDFELGYGSYELARGAVRYRDRNLFGLGRTLATEARVSVKSYAANALFKDPFLLGNRNTLEIGVGYLVREEPSFDLEAIDFDFIVSRDFEGPYDARFGYRVRFEEAENAPEDQEEGFIRTAGLFLSVRRDTRDSLVLPNAGSIIRFGILWSSPSLGADLDFLEVELRATKHVRLGERVVLAVGANLRTREILNEDANLPIQERLFLGGESSIRSFRESELGPFDADGDPLGGLTSLEAHVELRVRVWRGLHVAMFYDVGNIAVRSFAFEGPPGHAVGLGLRYYLAVGPIRVDFGYNPGRRFAADESWAIHLAFGFAF